MKELSLVIEKAVQSEKSLKFRELNNTFIFNVNKSANKKDIKDAVEKYFNVKVEDVNTVITRGKFRRVGKYNGKLPNTKKAYIKLKEGQRISALEV
ncbi:MAG: 50S ribosomal protein L23 [Deltaproteobacteria bacterium]|jgi:large subunit ribosomal protein L23|uniref:Large ribosomal subunit protein uL23 n=1 Tax=Candidatus Acidulodesulfobacterium acidiphilum TaxID=2597224 RepID=A0A520XCR4_9DELT|nr:50S ribosomal protein L23 [Deltaproteobacteria bacterium]MCL6120082.1 50S ribosomal protein L23 [Deltaproteobacteria bacterium]MDA8299875.1 50S ribosomal protein L23 [Deltaproteobacteria bacterium]RZV38994.1 MAG: 50S ribosomal protein L23 [Candidatus Acidulodesulfobacterium acidiphilum]